MTREPFMNKAIPIQLIGGGLVGSLLTIYLAQRNFQVELYERRPDPRQGMFLENRSINLAISARGMKALKEVGLLDEALKLAIPMKGRMLHDLNSKTAFVSYGQQEHEVIYSISRHDLNILLLNKAASYSNVKINFDMRCITYDIEQSKLSFKKSTESITIPAHCVIGTDGSGSTLRKSLQKQLPFSTHSEAMLEHGYKELHIPAANNTFQMEKHALHIWPRKNFMLIALPNLDGSFTVTLFLSNKGDISFDALKTSAQVDNFFIRYFPDATLLMPNLAEMFFKHPIGSMVTVKCFPWHVDDKLMLLGDASHAIVPFFGQGMNCGFEDCSELAALVDKYPLIDWKNLFTMLEQQRKPNSDAIADMAFENFIEMRDTVTDPKFQLKKQVGYELEKRFPGKFIPRYSMVAFHPEISYYRAKQQSLIQDKLLDEICHSIDSIDSLDKINWKYVAKFGLFQCSTTPDNQTISLPQIRSKL